MKGPETNLSDFSSVQKCSFFSACSISSPKVAATYEANRRSLKRALPPLETELSSFKARRRSPSGELSGAPHGWLPAIEPASLLAAEINSWDGESELFSGPARSGRTARSSSREEAAAVLRINVREPPLNASAAAASERALFSSLAAARSSLTPQWVLFPLFSTPASLPLRHPLTLGGPGC